MTDLLQEVDDMMRQERMAKLWNEHGNFIIGCIVAVIVATGVFSALKSWNTHVRTTQTATLMSALEGDDFAAKAPEIVKDLRPGLKAVALLNAAALKIKDGKTDEAAALFQNILDEGSTPDDLRGLAVIMKARLAKAQDAPKNLPSLLELTQEKSSPWRFHAALDAALLKAAAQDYEGARGLLGTILSAEGAQAAQLPPSLFERARALDHIYELKAPQNKEKQEG